MDQKAIFLTEEIKPILVFEDRILRKVVGPTLEDGTWTMKHYGETRQPYVKIWMQLKRKRKEDKAQTQEKKLKVDSEEHFKKTRLKAGDQSENPRQDRGIKSWMKSNEEDGSERRRC